LPTDEEWKVLEGAVDSQYSIGDPIWDTDYRRGYDAGMNLKTTSGWYYGGNGNDLFGFAGLPGGCRYYDGTFGIVGFDAYWWTSSEDSSNYAWSRMLEGPYPDVYRINPSKVYGFSVRCLRDN
jgi:uncharacterized protein (TIGR02145 family)